jgi:hypothetical protein
VSKPPGFRYVLRSFSTYVKFILIIDLNKGGLSVTNGIEEVVTQIVAKEEEKNIKAGFAGDKAKFNPSDYVILYCDSAGRWDGWDDATQTFFSLGCPYINTDYEGVMDYYLEHQTIK